MIHQAFAGALFDPRRQIEQSVREQPLATMIVSYLLASLSWVLADFLIHRHTQAAAALLVDSFIFLSLLTVLMALGMIVLHFFAELLGGKGDIGVLFWGVAQSATPLALLVPLALLSRTLGTMSGALYLPGKLGIFLWVLAAQVIAVSEAYRISVARSTFVYCLAYGTGLIGFLALSLLVPLAALAKLVMMLP